MDEHLVNDRKRVGTARKLVADPADTTWIGGLPYLRAKHQFQVIYMESANLDDAIEIGKDMILWNDYRRPERHIYHRWAEEVDDGRAEIPDRLERQTKKRLTMLTKSVTLRTIREQAALSKEYAASAREFLAKVKAGEFDEDQYKAIKDLSSILMHANNGVGFLQREVLNNGGVKIGQPQGTTQIGNLTINAGPPPPKRLKTQPPAVIIEAEVKELTAGRAD